MPKNRTSGREGKVGHEIMAMPDVRRIHIEAVLDRAHQDLLSVALGSGIEILKEMLREDQERLCGPKHRPDQQRLAYRHGRDEGPVVMGGRKVRVVKPRVRGVNDEEIPLPTWEWATQEDPLQQRTLQQLLAAVTCRAAGRHTTGAAPPDAISRFLRFGLDSFRGRGRRESETLTAAGA